MMEPIIQVENLCCQSGNRYLLRDITWQVNRGEHWVVFGLNGSGKTTLLSIIAGYKMATEGSLRVFGQPYTAQNILEIRKKIGWVSSSYFDNYYTKESALSIVLSGLCGTLGIDSTVTFDDYIRAKELLREWNLDRKFDLPFSTMSKGERQNVLIARALIASPEILVLDEPGTGLDVVAREQLLRKISKLAENQNMTIIYVTHYPEEILPVFDHCIILQQGRIVDQGEITDVMASERLSKALNADIIMQYMQDGRMDLRVKERR